MKSWKPAIQQVQALRSPDERGAAKSLEERAEEISHGSTRGN
ncbi:hypothetical protein HMPREF1246_1728 [Acidaminococcus sp. BV3L6]|nr:hypothetical protein HMPREF1246_1728 [Acidaminococcus sp. BV3L6]